MAQNKMKIIHASFNKNIFKKMNDDERLLFITLAHLLNEINFLLRYVLWTSDFSSKNDAEVLAQLSLSYFNTKLLAGKLKEAWELLKKYFLNNKLISIEFIKNGSKVGTESLDNLKKNILVKKTL